MYKLLKPIFFLFDAEAVHYFVMRMLTLVTSIPLGKSVLRSLYCPDSNSEPIDVFGLKFKNKIGLAAGFDKNAAYIDQLALLGFSHIEVGTVTPRPQNGNPKPRLFRLQHDRALINRMGFNNQGVAAMIQNLKNVKSNDIIIGGNIGKNKDTSNENAIHDYVFCFEQLYDYVHYFVINVSSPNTPGLRALQEKGPLTDIINALDAKRKEQKKVKPILLKIAPDLTDEQLIDIVELTNETALDGLIVSNTTIDRPLIHTKEKDVMSIGNGGLSGQPLLHKSNYVLQFVSSKTAKPIIGVGGIMTREDVETKLKNGASLVQVYTGFVYQGPSLVKSLIPKNLLTSN